MIEPIINKLWEATRADTKLNNLFYSFYIETDLKISDYPFAVLHSNTWADHDNKDAVDPGVSYLIEGSVAIRFYAEKQLSLTQFYPIWRNAFVTETKSTNFKEAGGDGEPGIDLTLHDMALSSNSIAASRINDATAWYLELVSAYLLTVNYT